MKKLISSIRIAFRALTMNKLRSALTMLGIVIGVASVIATVAIGSGATQRIQDQIASIGSNIIIITPGSTSSSGVRLGTGNAVTLSEADAREHSGTVSGRRTGRPVCSRRSPGGQREQQLGDDHLWRYSRLSDHSPTLRRRRSRVYAAGCRFGQQSRGARARRRWTICSAAPIRSARRSASRTCRSRSSAC